MNMPQNAQSWVSSANMPGNGFPLQNLPFCAFHSPAGEIHLGAGIGAFVLDLHGIELQGIVREGMSDQLRAACSQSCLNTLMACGPERWTALRRALTRALGADASPALQDALLRRLVPLERIVFAPPVQVPNYTDFYASIQHATAVGQLFRPDNPLLPNYKYLPIAYHGRASSLVQSGLPIIRPSGQVKDADGDPVFRPSTRLDYELEIAAYIGLGNPLGEPIPIASAERHIFGFSLMNDWSARDIQAWEYQPLGPFLGKNFATTLSPWVIVKEALAPFRLPRVLRAGTDPVPLAYLDDSALPEPSAIDMTLQVYLSTSRSRGEGSAPILLSTANLRELFWSFAQMVAHHTANGCNLMPGDLLGSGTVSGSAIGSEGSLMEKTRNGRTPLQLPNGETRNFLEDADEIILRGFCERPGLPRISMGECRGMVRPAPILPHPAHVE